jgi:hypothetical protein
MWTWIEKAFLVSDPIVVGQLSVKQLEHSNSAYMQSQLGIAAFHGISWAVGIVGLLLVIAIWWKPLMSLKSKLLSMAVIFGFIMLASAPAFAYYDTVDRDEWYEIPANATGFLIPLVGDNLASQGKFMSVDFLNAKKVPTKRVQIHHTKLRMATLERDVYVPAEKLILVDRSYYAREWSQGSSKGTSNKDEAVYFETADSIEGHTGFMAEASVSEEDVAKFLYTFGIKPDLEKYADENQRKYASVAWGYSLADVMDNNVRRKAVTIANREFGSRSTATVIKDKKVIIEAVNNETVAAYKDTGVSIRYIGYAEGLTWTNKEIQQAIDSVFISQTRANAVDARKQLLQVSMIEADVHIKEGVATAVQKWNGQLPALPNWVIMTSNIWDALTGWMKAGPESASVPVKK